MSSVIKFTDPARPIQGVAFSFENMADNAQGYLNGVRSEAAKIIAAAKHEAEGVRKKAEEEGRKAALAAVEKVLDEKVGQRMATLLPALKKMIDELQQAKQTWLNQWERQAIHTAGAMAARIVRQQLPQMPDVPLALVREALELAAGSQHLRIHLHPTDVESLRGQVEQLAKTIARTATSEIVPDADITPGGCRVETRHGMIDQQFEAQLARIEQELS